MKRKIELATEEKKGSEELPTPAVEPRKEEARENGVGSSFASTSFHGWSEDQSETNPKPRP